MRHLYPFPKKIQMDQSQAKWQIQSSKSVLVISGLAELRQDHDFDDSVLKQHLMCLTNKAKALDIPILVINADQLMHAMMELGEYVSQQKQIIIVGEIYPTFKALIQHISAISLDICLVDDAILLERQQQHIQWINRCVEMGIHHLNTQSLLRLWALSAPTDYILSDQGILLAVAEYLEIEPLEIDPYQDLRQVGLDSVAMLSLIGLWRANGADINFEYFSNNCTLSALMQRLKNQSE